MSENRFTLERSVERENGWACKDEESGIVCVFDDKKFNETQNFVRLKDIEIDALKIASLCNRMTEWLLENHKDKVY